MPELTAADHAEIQALYGRYAIAMDEGDRESVASCFTADATFRAPGDIDLAGREQILEFARVHHESPQGAARHNVTSISVRATETGAFGRAYTLLTAGGQVVAVAVYDDELVRESGGWRFAGRIATT